MPKQHSYSEKNNRGDSGGAKEKRADLHVHTSYSDGSFTPAEVVEYAKKIGLDCLSITDHDSVKGLDEAIRIGSSIGVEVVPAVEVSIEEDSKEAHILGYCIDHKDENILEALKQIREDRKERLYTMVDALNAHGINMNADDMIKEFGDVSISRLHIASYMEEKNLVSSWRDAFKKYIGDDKSCYVASFRLSAKDAIELIKSANGIPVIAHPGLNNVEKMLPKLLAQGVEGIEVYHSEHSNATVSRLKEYAQEHNLFITGGSDCHGRAKGNALMGNVTVPYSYVEALKQNHIQKASR